MDSPNPSLQEQSNRATLEKLALAQKLRIALPRANTECPTHQGSLCWGWKFDQRELNAVIPAILEARKLCFSEDRPVEFIGFSNGGYLLTHWYVAGMSPSFGVSPVSLIAVGSGKGEIAAKPAQFARSPKLTLVVGTADLYNYDPSESFFHFLKSLGANVDLIEFGGGHVLDEEALSQALAAK